MSKFTESQIEEYTKLFGSIGLEKNVVSNTIANPDVTNALVGVLQTADVTECDKKLGNLLYGVATKLPKSLENKRTTLTTYVADGRINSNQKLDAAVTYLKKLGLDEMDIADFEKNCGVGVEVTAEDIKATAKQIIDEKQEEIKKTRYRTPIGMLLLKARDLQPWADGKLMKEVLEGELADFLGPKTEEDLKPVTKQKKKAPKEAAKKIEEKKDAEPKKEKLSSIVGRDMFSSLNTKNLLEKRAAAGCDRILTRFPPEPNGYLHIGHAKAMRFDFTLATDTSGDCYLRYDDTNPEKENQEFIDSILDSVSWMGYKPWKVTFSSDYFQDLYDLAVELIKRGKAFVCNQTKAEMQKDRRDCRDSPYRTRSVEENLKMFEEMRAGKYEEGEVCLRMKVDMSHPNPCMRDPVAYRIKYVPHPHVGDKWCVYPTYDYTHCIVDSLEWISHSLCSLEFEIRRDSYYWLLEALDLYRPYVWEFSRLNITYTVLSKRKLTHLVNNNLVHGWDDPRLLTLNGLRRRGYAPEAINDFCDIVGVTRRGNEMFIDMHLLENCCRDYLDTRAKRFMAVIRPIKITLTNVADDFLEEVEAPFFPADPSKGSRKIPITKTFFIEESDFKEEDVKGYYGLAPGKKAALKYAGIIITCDEVVKDDTGKIAELKCTMEKGQDKKVKGYLHWLSEENSVKAEVRLYDTLFNSPDPNAQENWLGDINSNSEIILKDARVPVDLDGVVSEEKFQFERLGFFNVDFDTNAKSKRLVFNRIVALQESKERKKLNQ